MPQKKRPPSKAKVSKVFGFTLKRKLSTNAIVAIVVGLAIVGVGLAVYLTRAATYSGYACSGSPSTRPVLREGSYGNCVKHLQATLNIANVSPNIGVDGIFGPITKSTVVAFQRSRGIGADGIVGPITWGKLDQVALPGGYSAPAPAPAPTSSRATYAKAILDMYYANQVEFPGTYTKQDLELTAAGRPATADTYIYANLLSEVLAIAKNERANGRKLSIYSFESNGASHVTGSLHYKGRAADLWSSNQAAIFRYAYNNRSAWRIDELFHTPVPSGTCNLNNGVCSTPPPNHSGHVHLGVKE